MVHGPTSCEATRGAGTVYLYNMVPDNSEAHCFAEGTSIHLTGPRDQPLRAALENYHGSYIHDIFSYSLTLVH